MEYRLAMSKKNVFISLLCFDFTKMFEEIEPKKRALKCQNKQEGEKTTTIRPSSIHTLMNRDF